MSALSETDRVEETADTPRFYDPDRCVKSCVVSVVVLDIVFTTLVIDIVCRCRFQVFTSTLEARLMYILKRTNCNIHSHS